MEWAVRERVHASVQEDFEALTCSAFRSPIFIFLELKVGVDSFRPSIGNLICQQLETFQPIFESLCSKGHTVLVTHVDSLVDLNGFFELGRKIWLQDMDEAIGN
jgi:hypothetical protein